MIIPNADKDVEKLDVSYIAGGNVKCYRQSGKFWHLLITLNLHLPSDPEISLLGICHKEMKTYVYTKKRKKKKINE